MEVIDSAWFQVNIMLPEHISNMGVPDGLTVLSTDISVVKTPSMLSFLSKLVFPLLPRYIPWRNLNSHTIIALILANFELLFKKTLHPTHDVTCKHVTSCLLRLRWNTILKIIHFELISLWTACPRSTSLHVSTLQESILSMHACHAWILFKSNKS